MQTEDNKELILLRTKFKHLEDRLNTMEKSLSRVNNILGRFQMTDNGILATDKDSSFRDIEIYESVGGGFNFDDEPTSKDNDNELI